MPPPRKVRRIDLALQGGGAHGAFTWGVLDRLLDDPRIEIDAISGTSAGAMNAVVLAHGLMVGGRSAAREALRRFWGRVSQAAGPGSAVLALFHDLGLPTHPLSWYAEWMTRTFTPAQLNPFDINPLRDILTSEVDFARLRDCQQLRLFISVTHVGTGKLREFRTHELRPEVVMASACLPTVFRTVEIDGEPYWDGGYVGNPSLLPLIAESPAHDLLLVQINPAARAALPQSPQEIIDRLNEITFNSSLVKELRTVALLQQLLRSEARAGAIVRPPGSLFSQMLSLKLHRIDAQDELSGFGAATKMHAAWPFVQQLHQIGWRAADHWLDTNFTHLGRRSTLALDAYL